MSRDGKALLGLLLLAAAALLTGLGVRDVWERAEGRPCVIGRDILRTGRVQPPWIAGEPYLNKPPLFHALVAAAYGLTGSETVFVARLPAVLSALAVVGLTFGLGRSLGGTATGVGAGVFLLASHRFYTLGRTSELEMLLTAGCTLVCLAVLESGEGRRGARWPLLAAFGGAVAALGKAPQMALLFPALFVIGRMIDRRSLRPAWRGAFPWAVGGIVLATLAYYGPLWADETWRAALLERLRGGNVRHERAFWYYAPTLLSGLAPAVILLPRTIAVVRRDFARWRAVVLTVAAGLVVLSCASSKQSHYLLPLYPMIAILGGASVADALRRGARLELGLATVAATLTGLLAPVALGVFGAAGRVAPLVVVLAAAAAGLGSAAGLALARWRRCPRGLPPRIGWLVGAALLAALCTADVTWSTLANPDHSPAPAIRELRQIAAGRPLASCVEKPHVLFYLDRDDVTFLGSMEEATRFLAGHEDGVVLVEADDGDPVPPPLGPGLVVHVRRFDDGGKGYALVERRR